MKKKNKEFGDYEIKFWKDWLESDGLKRADLVEKLPIVKEISYMGKFPKKIRIHSFALVLNSLFEDLESAVYTKIRLKKKK
ncbi:MAG: hypothetical protein AABX76_02040 [Nanoarchaeota archaeon]